ncbi:Choline/ethanolaminephosphotransferase 1 [Biomphalaria glabrata]|uniref:diacylglycerol cholinephosphotransferase n=1 Tax=Biomphalaria glabrata TaxID=6526 RepID=A0A9W3BKQ3_BIOGL|nr:cholinephosphotransferase 1-like [Biomphalaria glabrata]KAI8729540.1 cholinephosphotransferase 1 [Biomphalaria glabrata]KAI8781354.1 cholinephosphotransferase 1 [Biomphalaria glabrata]
MAAPSFPSVVPRKDGFYDKYIRNQQILSQAQLKRLMEHKYSAEGQSIIEPPMQVFWKWIVEQLPLWWAPNAITIVGLIINVVTTLILAFYSPDCKQEAPRWAYFLSGLGLFIYQTLDAIDGKQARRTKSSTPLGELFDHGCDSISTGTVMLGASITLQLGYTPGWVLFENLAAYALFYCAHWQTYVCGTLKFGKIDVTEGQLMIILVYVLAGLFGPQFWSYEIPVLHTQLKMIPIYFSLLGAGMQLISAFKVILLQGGVGKNGSTVAGTSTIFPVVPITAVILLACMIQQKSPSHLFENNPCLYLLAFGLLAAKVTNRLVVAHMTKSEMDFWDTGFLGPGALFLNQYFNCWFNEYFVLWLCLLWVLFDILRYSASVCQEICDYLQIYCFTITSRPTSNKKIETSNGALS